MQPEIQTKWFCVFIAADYSFYYQFDFTTALSGVISVSVQQSIHATDEFMSHTVFLLFSVWKCCLLGSVITCDTAVQSNFNEFGA